MPIPKYNELYIPFLTAIEDGNVHTMKEVREKVAEMLSLGEEELSERLPSGNQTFDNRIGWAKTYLKKAGLVEVPKRAHFKITKEGKRLLDSGERITDKLLAEKYDTFAVFKGKKDAEGNMASEEQHDMAETPMETFERVFGTINEQLADDLLTEIMNQSPGFFESLVVDLMKAMNYGDGFVTKLSGDDGIDGIIHEDKLGFNLIYIQAKRWKPEITVGKPEIQKFAGAMMGPPRVEKGLFITTAKFSQKAREFADAQHIILVDGQKITELMIEYGIGVSAQKTYCIKRIDSDYFSDNII